MPTTGLFSVREPAEPRKGGPPTVGKVKMPPSLATS